MKFTFNFPSLISSLTLILIGDLVGIILFLNVGYCNNLNSFTGFYTPYLVLWDKEKCMSLNKVYIQVHISLRKIELLKKSITCLQYTLQNQNTSYTFSHIVTKKQSETNFIHFSILNLENIKNVSFESYVNFWCDSKNIKRCHVMLSFMIMTHNCFGTWMQYSLHTINCSQVTLDNKENSSVRSVQAVQH